MTGPFSPASAATGARRTPRASAVPRLALALVLGTLLAVESEELARVSGHINVQGHLAVWATGLIASLCLLPLGSLVVRATVATAASWTTTALLLAQGNSLCAWGLSESAALLVLLALVLWRAPLRPAVALGSALGAGLLSASVRDPGAGSTTVVTYALFVAGVAALGLCLRCRDAERATAVAAARDAERREVAGELHDFVSHHVAAMTIMAKATGGLAADERLAAGLRTIEEAGDEALTTSRRLLRVLQQEQAPRQPLADLSRIDELIQNFRATPGNPALTLHMAPGFDAGLAPELAASVHRMIDEALTNVRRHSPSATEVHIVLHRRNAHLHISVRDNGTDRTRAPEDSGGLGLISLTERADALDGSLTAGPLPGGGWEVLAVLPCADG